MKKICLLPGIATILLTVCAGCFITGPDDSYKKYQLRGYGTFYGKELPGNAEAINVHEFIFEDQGRACVFLS